MELKLDSKTFKALSNEKRVEILKLLGERRHTQSEIAEELGLAVPTVKEHLSALAKAGLVEQHDEGRKWKYYSLTKSGKGILAPEEMRIWIMLGVFVLSAVGAAYRFFKQGDMAGADSVAMKAAVAEPAEAMMFVVEETQAAAPSIVVDGFTLALVIIAIFAAILMLGLYFRQRRYVAQLGKSLKKS